MGSSKVVDITTAGAITETTVREQAVGIVRTAAAAVVEDMAHIATAADIVATKIIILEVARIAKIISVVVRAAVYT